MKDVASLIKAGEFSFCSRCGRENSCRPGKLNFMCTRCLRNLFPQCEPQCEDDGEEQRLQVEFEWRLGRVTYQWRKELAELRRYKERDL